MVKTASKYLVCFFMLFLFSQTLMAEDITVEVSLDRDTIGMDEQATLIVVVSGESQNLPAPKLPTLPRFQVYS